MAFLASWFWQYNSRHYTETKEEKKAKEEAEKQWKEGRVRETEDMKSALKEALKGWQLDKLQFERDLAAVADILKKNVETTDKLTSVAERVNWHGRILDDHKEKFKEIHEDINGLRDDIKFLERAKP